MMCIRQQPRQSCGVSVTDFRLLIKARRQNLLAFFIGENELTYFSIIQKSSLKPRLELPIPKLS